MLHFVNFKTPCTKHDLDLQLGVAGNSDSIFTLTAVGDYNDLSGCRMLNILLSTSLLLHKKLWKTVQSVFMTVLLLQSALVMTSLMTSSIMSLTRWRRINERHLLGHPRIKIFHVWSILTSVATSSLAMRIIKLQTAGQSWVWVRTRQ